MTMIAWTAFRSRIVARKVQKLRKYSTFQQHISQEQPIRYLRPILWSTLVITGIYTFAAGWELNNEVERYKNRNVYWFEEMDFDELESSRLKQANIELIRRQQTDISIYDLASTGRLAYAWNSLTSVEKAAWTAIGLNTALYLPSKNIPAIASATFHLPLANRNWTLLTSTFGHAGPLHLLVNMYVLNNFTLPVSSSQSFQGSAAHCTAFYLSSGILSCLAYHLQSAVKPAYRAIPCLGASGAICAMVGVFGMSYPDAQIGIILLPFSFPAQQALAGLAAFEIYGTVIGTRMGLAHVSHLTGLAIGAGYVYFDLASNLWKRLKLRIYKAHFEGTMSQES